MTAVIEARNLSKWYGNILGLSGVSLDICPGITGLLGPNGAGKSTFMKLITGQIKPNIGSVAVLGKNAWNAGALNGKIGFCPEADAFYEEISGYEFLYGLLRLGGFDREEACRWALKALETVELAGDKDRKIRAYSRGMRQRIKFAQAIAHDPEIIILDEPFNGLDPLGKRKLIRLIKGLRDEGKTILVSSHVLPEIEAVTARIILIHQGRVFAEGDIPFIRDLLEKHPHIISIVSSDPRVLAESYVREPYVLKMEFGGDGENADRRDIPSGRFLQPPERRDRRIGNPDRGY